MPGTSSTHDLELIIENIGGGGGDKHPPASGDGGGDDGKRPRKSNPSPKRYYTGIALGMVSILMFFMALASAFLVRRSRPDWVPVHIPLLIWVNTLVLLASSGTLEMARKRMAAVDLESFKRLWTLTTVLGLVFVTGQFVAWKQLASQGIFMATNPASSFFYIFTGAHALHLLGGVTALLYVLRRNFELAKVTRAVAAEVTSFYWHFMDALWLFLLALLYLGK